MARARPSVFESPKEASRNASAAPFPCTVSPAPRQRMWPSCAKAVLVMECPLTQAPQASPWTGSLDCEHVELPPGFDGA